MSRKLSRRDGLGEANRQERKVRQAEDEVKAFLGAAKPDRTFRLTASPVADIFTKRHSKVFEPACIDLRIGPRQGRRGGHLGPPRR